MDNPHFCQGLCLLFTGLKWRSDPEAKTTHSHIRTQNRKPQETRASAIIAQRPYLLCGLNYDLAGICANTHEIKLNSLPM